MRLPVARPDSKFAAPGLTVASPGVRAQNRVSGRVGAFLALPLALALAMAPAGVRAGDGCSLAWTTGYVRGAHSDFTADGSSVWSGESLAAVDWQSWIPFGTYISVEGLGAFRVADVGLLADAGVDFDLLVDSRAEAFAVTGWRKVCVL